MSGLLRNLEHRSFWLHGSSAMGGTGLIGLKLVRQQGRYMVKVPNTGRGGGDSGGPDDRWSGVNLSSSNTIGTDVSPWECFAAASSRLMRRLLSALIRPFKGR